MSETERLLEKVYAVLWFINIGIWLVVGILVGKMLAS